MLWGVVLAGGHSNRMGRDKALLRAGSETLLANAARVLGECCEHVLIAGGAHQYELAQGVRAVSDLAPNQGPLAGILPAMELASAEAADLAVLGVDLPNASAEVFAVLHDKLEPSDAAVPVVDGQAQPLHAVFAAWAHGKARDYYEAGGRSLMGLLDTLEWTAVTPQDLDLHDGRFAANVNDPESAERHGLS